VGQPVAPVVPVAEVELLGPVGLVALVVPPAPPGPLVEPAALEGPVPVGAPAPPVPAPPAPVLPLAPLAPPVGATLPPVPGALEPPVPVAAARATGAADAAPATGSFVPLVPPVPVVPVAPLAPVGPHAAGTSTSAVPVLPATTTPGICASTPVPLLTTSCISSRILRATLTGITRGKRLGRTSEKVGTGRRPTSAIVAATRAICSGEASTCAWPIALSPSSKASVRSPAGIVLSAAIGIVEGELKP